MSKKEGEKEKKQLKIRRGKVDSVDIYEIKDNELETLANGSSGGLNLNFAIFLLSIAFSGITALSTSTFNSDIIREVVLLSTILGCILGFYFLLSWYKQYQPIKELVNKIKARIEDESNVSGIKHPAANAAIQKDDDEITPMG